MWYFVGALIYFASRGIFKAIGMEKSFDTIHGIVCLLIVSVFVFLWWSNRY